MNGSYKRFLEAAAESFGDPAAARSFIAHVDEVASAPGGPAEPDFTAIALDEHVHIVDTVDAGWIENCGYDPEKIGPALDDVLESVADGIYERAQDVDLGYLEELRYQLERRGFDLDEISFDGGNGDSGLEALAAEKDGCSRSEDAHSELAPGVADGPTR